MSLEVLTGDCREVLAGLESESVDAVVTDPPYGVTSLGWDVPVPEWLSLVDCVLKPSGSVWVFGSLRSLMEMQPYLGSWRIAQDIVWEKHNGSNFHADRFRRVHEIAVQLYRARWADIYRAPQYTMDATRHAMRRKARPPHTGMIGAATYRSRDGGPRMMRSVLHVRSCHGTAVHPTQKPVEVLMPLIEYSCPPGGIVLDPFAGSGSTGVAALMTHRSAVLIEQDPRHVTVIQQRCSAIQQTLPLDEEAV